MPESVNALEQYYRDLGPATANPNFLAQGRRANVAQRSMPGPTMQAANTQLAKELGSMGDRGAIPDLINRGLIANTAGLPVDLVNTVLQSLGLGAEQPVGGSDSIRRALEYYGLSSETKRPMLETLAGLTPPKAVMGAARAAGQGAEAVGRAAAPVAGQAIENYLVRSGGVLPMDTWHGSPHRFPPTAKNPLGEFDPMKIGTGEGAQAYGAGAGYLAENPQTARIYSADRAYVGSAMQGKPSTINFDDPAWLAQNTIDEFGDTSKATSHLKMVQRIAAKHQSPETKAQVQAAIDLLESGNITTKGFLYKVDLPDEQIAKMLDWDKPLSQQHPDVQAALGKLMPKGEVNPHGLDMGGGGKILDNRMGQADPKQVQPWVLSSGGSKFGLSQKDVDRMVADYGANTTGENAYTRLTGSLGRQEKATAALRQAGIPGIRYLDQGSRIGGKGTSNFVVFDPKHMNIIGRE